MIDIYTVVVRHHPLVSLFCVSVATQNKTHHGLKG